MDNLKLYYIVSISQCIFLIRNKSCFTTKKKCADSWTGSCAGDKRKQQGEVRIWGEDCSGSEVFNYQNVYRRVAQAVARLATTRMVGGLRPTPDARA